MERVRATLGGRSAMNWGSIGKDSRHTAPAAGPALQVPEPFGAYPRRGQISSHTKRSLRRSANTASSSARLRGKGSGLAAA